MRQPSINEHYNTSKYCIGTSRLDMIVEIEALTLLKRDEDKLVYLFSRGQLNFQVILLESMIYTLYKNMLYKNIEAGIGQILRIF